MPTLTKAHSESNPSLTTISSQNRGSLRHLNQVPQSRLSEDWVTSSSRGRDPAPLRPSLSPRQKSPLPPSQHWVIEEAERRRLAETSGKERLQKLQSRQKMAMTSQPASAVNHVNMQPSSTAEPFIAALKQAGVFSDPRQPQYRSQDTQYQQDSQHRVQDSNTVRNYPEYQQSKYPMGIYADVTGYPREYQPGVEVNVGYEGGTLNPRPAQPQNVNKERYHQPVRAPVKASNTTTQHHVYSPSGSSDNAPPPPLPYRSPPQHQEEGLEEIVSVAGHQQCAHCNLELGEEFLHTTCTCLRELKIK